MAEKFAALENGEISVPEAKAYTGMAIAIAKTCQLEMVNNATLGLVREIDFMEADYKNRYKPEVQKQLQDKFFKEDKGGGY